jgi:replicative DNA helicase
MTIITYSEDLEKHIINQLVYFNNYLKDFLFRIKTDYFYTEYNKILFQIICELFYSNKPITSEFILEICKTKNTLLYDYFFNIILLENTKSIHLLDEQVKQLETYYYKRLTINEFDNAKKRIFEYSSCEQILRDIQLTSNKILNKFEYVNDNNIEKIVDLFDTEDEIIYTTFDKIDNFTQVKKNELIIIGARPSIGKSAFSLNLAVNLSKTINVVFISLEMSQKEIINRIFTIVSNKTRYEILENKNILDYTKETVKQLKLTIIDKPISINEIHSLFIKSSEEIGAIFIDYIQLLDLEKKTNSRYQDVSEITRQLKLFTMQYNVPIFALSQLNRAVELRNDKKPILSDLRESGTIEQDANQVWLLHRDSYYQTTEDKEKIINNEIEIIVAKNRSGKTGIIKMKFIPEKNKLFD